MLEEEEEDGLGSQSSRKRQRSTGEGPEDQDTRDSTQEDLNDNPDDGLDLSNDTRQQEFLSDEEDPENNQPDYGDEDDPPSLNGFDEKEVLYTYLFPC